MQACYTHTGHEGELMIETSLISTSVLHTELFKADSERATVLQSPRFRIVVKAWKHNNVLDDQWTGAILEVSVVCIKEY